MADHHKCPLCSSDKSRSVSSKLFICKNCKIIYNTAYKQFTYNRNYFIEDYLKQYGKTYRDDYGNIYRLSQKRLSRILGLNRLTRDISRLSLLDIGCAMGFFLKCASDNGIGRVAGVEISDFGADYCKRHYNINVINKPFEEITEIEIFHIVTAWYFLEHCNDPAAVLKRIFELLPEKGIFAFSVPSFFGPQFYFHRSKWIDEHPCDHKIDLSPLSAKKLLRRIGFKRVIIRPASFHPERIIPENSFFYRPFSYIYTILAGLFSFSDTLEIYAVK